MWYVVIAVENEPVLQTVPHDASGTETTVAVRRLHVVRPEEGAARRLLPLPCRELRLPPCHLVRRRANAADHRDPQGVKGRAVGRW